MQCAFILMRRKEETNGIRRIVTRNKRGRNYGRQMVGCWNRYYLYLYPLAGRIRLLCLGVCICVGPAFSESIFRGAADLLPKESWFVEEYTIIIIIIILSLHKVVPYFIFRFLFPRCGAFDCYNHRLR